MVWIVAGLVVTYAAVMMLAVNKPDGWRGERVMSYFDVRENDRMLDLAIVGIVAGIVGVLALARRPLRLPGPFLVGQALGIAAVVIIILTR